MAWDNIHHNRRIFDSELKMEKKDVFIIIAAFNEELRIRKVIQNLKKAGYHNIVATDDGSKDKTYEALQKENIYALKHVINRGQGAALKTGIDFALKKGAKYLVTFDADGQHRVEDLEAVIMPVREGAVDVTLGSRFLDKKTKMPFLRKLTLKIGVLIQFIFYGLWLSDAHNGFRCFSQKAAELIDIKSDRMEHASEIVEQIKLKKLKYKEIPVTIIYNEDTLRKGHGGFIQAIKVFSKMLFRKIFH